MDGRYYSCTPSDNCLRLSTLNNKEKEEYEQEEKEE